MLNSIITHSPYDLFGFGDVFLQEVPQQLHTHTTHLLLWDPFHQFSMLTTEPTQQSVWCVHRLKPNTVLIPVQTCLDTVKRKFILQQQIQRKFIYWYYRNILSQNM